MKIKPKWLKQKSEFKDQDKERTRLDCLGQAKDIQYVLLLYILTRMVHRPSINIDVKDEREMLLVEQ